MVTQMLFAIHFFDDVEFPSSFVVVEAGGVEVGADEVHGDVEVIEGVPHSARGEDMARGVVGVRDGLARPRCEVADSPTSTLKISELHKHRCNVYCYR